MEDIKVSELPESTLRALIGSQPAPADHGLPSVGTEVAGMFRALGVADPGALMSAIEAGWEPRSLIVGNPKLLAAAEAYRDGCRS